ncbi:hypothetical protein SUNI508_05204 [Seiridium unicorne]|uniref:Uncharacterized protein n=1 Tax=Seiridium unicorne TaxID=138068 RepID=A0ABR2V5R2_9PEZI
MATEELATETSWRREGRTATTSAAICLSRYTNTHLPKPLSRLSAAVISAGWDSPLWGRCNPESDIIYFFAAPDLDLDDRLDYLMERVGGPLRYLALRYNDTYMLPFEMRPRQLDGLKTLTFIIEWQPSGLQDRGDLIHIVDVAQLLSTSTTRRAWEIL